MTAILLGQHAPNTPEWHALREQGIGASEIAAVVGLSPFESPFTLWHRKKGNLPGPDPANPLFYWGHALEPLVAARYASAHADVAVVSVGTYGCFERPWQLANPDRNLYEVGAWHEHGHGSPVSRVLEIKTTRYPDQWGPSGSTEIPLHVRCQVMQQMDVLEVPFADVAVLIGGNDYREYRIDYDTNDAVALREAGEAFWASLQTDDEPPIDASWETYEAVRVLHPDIDDDLDVEVDPVLHETYAQTKSAEAAAKSAHRQAKSELMHVLGKARRGLVDGVPVVRRQQARGDSVALYSIKPKEAA